MSLLSRLAVQAARAYGILSSADKTKVVADYLVVAGGGGSGGGGGGAGGYQTSTANLSTLNTYSIAVGAGGSGVVCVGGGTSGIAGSNSSISGTGLSTITSVGGGYGGGGVNGGSGGSGGGSGSSGSLVGGGSGTSGQGNNGGGNGGFTSSPFPAGGGGGAGAVGGTATSTTQAGNGGIGLASSISGSSVYYAGGGGGGYYSTGGTATTGGTGGGGAGNSNTGNAVSGTANTGGGGGGTGPSYLGGSGGSGIVIISYTSATPKFVGGTITTSGGKQIHTFTSSGTLSPITPITASYLVVAGGAGGAGGNFHGGGGGAGGLLTSSTTLYSGATYIVTVGAGGAGGVANAKGVAGSNSVLSGTGITTVTTTGGGGAGTSTNGYASTLINGNAGGSGGGAGGISQGGGSATGGAGTSGQGNAGGNVGGNVVPYRGGGGGGAGAAGATGGSGTGNGGAGTASSISGSSVTYAGGGGGSTYSDPTPGTGGAGGGGNGGSDTVAPTAGTANTGGGGGGAERFSTATGGAGGSGIVIISYAGSQAFNGGLVTSSGGNTIHTFTSTGALTPLTNNLNNSLRFRSSASAYLNRTPTLTGNRQTFTYSFWTKLGGVISAGGDFISSNNAAGSGDAISLQSSSRIAIAGSGTNFLVTTQLLRDPSAWYHIVVAVDTTQATSANRIKLYINGNQVTAFNTASYPAQNYNFTYWNSSSYAQLIGGGYSYLDGYMTDINFIDGQALEPYYFGNNDANGVWKPIQYKGTYGTNGFYLTFGNTTSTTTLGYDSSPNGNNWTCNNISLTAGTTYDAMTDVPTNTSATVANYATLNPLMAGTPFQTNAAATVSQGNLQADWGTTSSGSLLSTIAMTSGKWYFEGTVTGTNTREIIGIVNSSAATTTYAGGDANGWGYFSVNGNKYNNGSATSYGATYTTNDIIGVAFDADAGSLTFYKNGTSQGTAFTGLASGTYFFAVSDANASLACGWNVNFGQRPFSYTPPTGYVALNTYNLPTPTILQGNKYMDATLYTGTGTALNVVNAGQFKPDFVWAKNRSAADSSGLYDSVRGVNQRLISNLTNAEDTSSGVSAFNSNGFSLGTAANYNTSGNNFVGWSWQAGQGSTSSNTSGSITSTVSVNTTAGFSVVTYTGTGANATVGHGLGVAPKMIILKNRGAATNWKVWQTSLSGTEYLEINTTAAKQTAATVWNSTVPSSTVFSIGTSGDVNTNTGTYVAYCWAEIAGFSKFGSYTGNGSTDGPFIFTGFRPKFVMIKCTSNADSWYMLDTSRSTYNATNQRLFANASSAESSGDAMDILSNGFKNRSNTTINNLNGGTYIYMAFAENPFKNALAR